MINAETKISPEKPLVDNVTTFFMNKTGDIVYLSYEEQMEFLLKYQQGRAIKWLWRGCGFKEYKS